MLLVTASFPESNPFGRKSPFSPIIHYCVSVTEENWHWHADVINGEQNKLLLTIENRMGKNVTLLTVAGEFLDPTTGQLIKAVRTFCYITTWVLITFPIHQANNLTYGISLPDTARIQLPYNFYSEWGAPFQARMLSTLMILFAQVQNW